MATPILVLMITLTFLLVAGVWLFAEKTIPKMMRDRLARESVTHASAVEALEIAIARSGNDTAQLERLTASLNTHRSALRALGG